MKHSWIPESPQSRIMAESSSAEKGSVSSIRLTTSHTILASACEGRGVAGLRLRWGQSPGWARARAPGQQLSPQPAQEKRATRHSMDTVWSPRPWGTRAFRAFCHSNVLLQQHQPRPVQPECLQGAGRERTGQGPVLHPPAQPGQPCFHLFRKLGFCRIFVFWGKKINVLN